MRPRPRLLASSLVCLAAVLAQPATAGALLPEPAPRLEQPALAPEPTTIESHPLIAL